MIIKPRETSIQLKQAIALDERTYPQHPKKSLIKENRAKRQAGYRGECALDYPLSLLPAEDYLIFHDVRLPQQNINNYFQMDTLIYTKKCWINLESKNLAGSLYFDEEMKQLIQTHCNQKKVYPCPIVQTMYHELHFKNWLHKHQLPQLPIYSFTVITNPNTLIETSPKSNLVYKKVIRNEYVTLKVQQLEKNPSNIKYTQNQLEKTIQLIKKEHDDLYTPILTKFDLTKEDIIQGVRCPKCQTLPMQRIYGNWFCPRCASKDKIAHLSAIEDYTLLISPHFTSAEIRQFLQIDCLHLTHRLLKNSNIRCNGHTKSAKYELI